MDADDVIQLEKEIMTLRERLHAARRAQAPERVGEHVFVGQDDRPVTLADLFGEKDDLLAIHNMGRGCTYCTLWADGFNGVAPHLMDRAAFVLMSPDETDVRRAFAAERGWTFPMVGYGDSTFAADMGFTRAGGFMPGVSALRRREDGSIVRVGKAFFGPGDEFCGLWHLFELLADGPNGWHPRLEYDS